MIAASGEDLPMSDAMLAGTWTFLYEELVAGIIHSMNNSATVLGVSLELSSPEDAQGDVALFRRELAQLVRLIGLTSALSSRSIRAEALELQGVLDLALMIHALSSATRAVPCVAQVNGFVPPVRVSRTSLLRVLLFMIDSAKRAPRVDGASVVVEVSGDADSVVVRAPSGMMVSSDAAALAIACGGTLGVEDGWAVFALPSLAYLRRASRGEVTLPDSPMPTRATGS